MFLIEAHLDPAFEPLAVTIDQAFAEVKTHREASHFFTEGAALQVSRALRFLKVRVDRHVDFDPIPPLRVASCDCSPQFLKQK